MHIQLSLKAVLLSVLCFSAITGQAQELVKSKVAIANSPLNDYKLINDTLSKSADLTQESLKIIGTGIDFILNPIDDFFSSDEQNNIRTGASQVKITYATLNSEFNKFESNVSYSLKLALPKTQNRLNLFAESINESLNDDSSNNTAIKTETKSDIEIGLFSILDLNDYIDFRWKLGAQITDSSADFFITFGNEVHNQINDQWSLRFKNELFSYQSIGEGFLSNLSFDEKISAAWDFRSKTSLIYYKQQGSTFYNQSFNWYYKASEKRRYSFNVGQDWSKNEGEPILENKHYASVTMRQQIYKKWVYLSIKPGIQYQDINNFAEDPYLFMSLEIYSNDVK